MTRKMFMGKVGSEVYVRTANFHRFGYQIVHGKLLRYAVRDEEGRAAVRM
jgi:hypothetical protein